jgi:hypothetical protein
VTATASDTRRFFECVKAVLTTVRTGPSCPGGLETPLDDGVERLGPKLY